MMKRRQHLVGDKDLRKFQQGLLSLPWDIYLIVILITISFLITVFIIWHRHKSEDYLPPYAPYTTFDIDEEMRRENK